MSFLPNVKQIRLEDLGAKVPEWVSNLLTPLNSFMESVYTILNKNISFDNLNCKVFKYTFTTDSGYTGGTWSNITFQSGIIGKTTGVILLSAVNMTNTSSVSLLSKSIEWTEQENNIVVKYIAGLANSTKYNITLLII